MSVGDDINNLLSKSQQLGVPRDYVGASALGHACKRKLRYVYDRTPADKPLSAKQDRLFDVGRMIEERTKKELRSIGFVIEEGGCFSLREGKFKGTCDGIITHSPLPEIKTPCILEIKSMNTFSWAKLAKTSIAEHSPSYHAQVIIYQAFVNDGECRDNPALVVVVNKNNSEQYAELLEFSPVLLGELMQKLDDVTNSDIHPKPMGLTWECDYCEFNIKCNRDHDEQCS